MHTNELSSQNGGIPGQCKDTLLGIPTSRTEQLLLEARTANHGKVDYRAAMEAIRTDREIELRVVEVLLLSALDGFRNASESLEGLAAKKPVLESVGILLSEIYRFATERLGMSSFMADAIIYSHAYGLDAYDYMMFALIEHSGCIPGTEQL